MKRVRSQAFGNRESAAARELPAGVALAPLPEHADNRGAILELYQIQWDTGVEPVQWNLFSSAPNVLRGMHVHLRHTDYLIVISGSLLVGLRDLRAGSPTDGHAALFELRAEHNVALIIPPGVGHAFYCQQRASMLQGVSHYFDTSDEFGCKWADPDLGIDWPDIEPTVSERDRNAQSMRQLLRELPPFSAF
jgi:dTDP-4-dehydrorhamnose 3,5-epimerase